ncbi:MAG: hypothetical protein RLZZ488_30 [Pseudomonadota bacterium]|jgi:hypothetical protein
MKLEATFLVLLLTVLAACKDAPAPTESTEQTLRSEYGRKKIYLWNKHVKSSKDKILRSCWYYKEAPPSLGLSDSEALLQSVRLNDFAIHDGHIHRQMENILKEKLINAGAEFVPCGLATVSVGAAIASGGASAIAFGVSSAWMVNNCIKNSLNIQRYLRELRGSSDGMASFELGETKLGRVFPASKAETDMFREAIRRARQLGLEDKVPCPRASQLRSEIK